MQDISAIRQGRPPLEERKRAEQVMLEPTIIAQVQERAKRERITKSAMYRRLILQALEQSE